MNHTEAHEMFGLLMDLDEHGVAALAKDETNTIMCFAITPPDESLVARLRAVGLLLKPFLLKVDMGDSTETQQHHHNAHSTPAHASSSTKRQTYLPDAKTRRNRR